MSREIDSVRPIAVWQQFEITVNDCSVNGQTKPVASLARASKGILIRELAVDVEANLVSKQLRLEAQKFASVYSVSLHIESTRPEFRHCHPVNGEIKIFLSSQVKPPLATHSHFVRRRLSEILVAGFYSYIRRAKPLYKRPVNCNVCAKLTFRGSPHLSECFPKNNNRGQRTYSRRPSSEGAYPIPQARGSSVAEARLKCRNVCHRNRRESTDHDSTTDCAEPNQIVPISHARPYDYPDAIVATTAASAIASSWWRNAA